MLFFKKINAGLSLKLIFSGLAALTLFSTFSSCHIYNLSLEDFLKENDIPGIYDIDTRALVKILREKGVMNGLITDSIQDIPFHEIKKYVIKDIVPEVSSKEVKILEPSRAERNVVLMDFGLKDNIARELVKRNCKVTIVPWNTSPGEIKKINPDGIMLSNGPGDPSENTLIIENLQSNSVLCFVQASLVFSNSSGET